MSTDKRLQKDTNVINGCKETKVHERHPAFGTVKRARPGMAGAPGA